MTAEIAILNRSAVALAADSAVTITSQTGQKIYNTVNKLFMLSKYEPIGVMVNGTAELMGVPWELVIKLYRQSVGEESFSDVESASRHFVGWLCSNEVLFPSELRHHFVASHLLRYMAVVVAEMDEKVQASLSNAPLHEAQIASIAHEAVESVLARISTLEDLEWCSEDQAADAISALPEPLTDLYELVFESVPLDPATVELLDQFCHRVLHKDLFSGDGSGIVIAGFGTDEAFPSLCHFEIEGLVGSGIKAKSRQETKIGPLNGASISPFAQREMVDTFISGVAPEYSDALDGFLSGLLAELPERAAAAVDDPAVQAQVADQIRSVGHAAVEHFKKELAKYERQRFVEPIVSAVEVLPKEELAEMAEALVNLTSFKRRVSLGEVETVGGPVDVAVISKGDGFVWIKRKHYFQPELNTQFFANYYRRS